MRQQHARRQHTPGGGGVGSRLGGGLHGRKRGLGFAPLIALRLSVLSAQASAAERGGPAIRKKTGGRHARKSW